MSNQPDRFALFILGPDEKRVEIAEDTIIPNAATVTLNKEDHTLGNLLRHSVLSVPGVLFSGYRVPHPLEPRTVLKIQTDGSLTPVQALQIGCEKVISTVGSVRNSFKTQCQFFEDQQGVAGGTYGSSQRVGLPGAPTVGSATGATAPGYGAGTGYGYGDTYQRGDEGTGYVDI